MLLIFAWMGMDAMMIMMILTETHVLIIGKIYQINE